MAHGLRTPRGKQASKQATVRLVGLARRGRSALLLGTALQASTLLLLAAPARAQPAANARPSGGIVTAGSASIGTSASTTTITQSSQRTAINWQSFDVGSQQTVDFIQPSSSSVALNRVISSNPSQIAGRIDANGQVILINQSGVIFDQGAQVNTAGLIVSAAGMSNVNLMAGKLVFDQAAHPNAAVVNQGSITVRQAGLAALVAPQVANSGVITATLGHVVLAGAKTATLDLYGDGLVSLDVNNQVTQVPTGPGGKAATALVTNTGLIQADGGTVQLTAREADGLVQTLVQAGGKISADSVGSKTGTVVLGGLGGSIVLSGVVTADGAAPGSTGGAVQVDANQAVTLAAGSQVSASGPAGGGTVAIGTTLARAAGGPGITSTLTAQTVQIAAGANIAADATSNGDGGHVTVLSSLSTSMSGTITARGGPHGGNGGFIETSGHTLSIADVAMVSAAAPKGVAGTWLLDPYDVSISGNITQAINDSGDVGGTDTLSATDVTANVNNKQIETTLDAGTNVSINTGPQNGPQAGNITVNAAVSWDTATTLTLNAAAGIVIKSPLQGTSAGSVLALNAAGGTVTQSNTGLITVGTLTGSSVGGATLNQGNTVNTLGPWTDSGVNNTTGLSFNNTKGFQTVGTVTSTGPVLLTTTAGGITVNGIVSSVNGTVTTDDSVTITAGDVTVNDAVSSDNSVTINATGALAIPGTVNAPDNDLTGNSIDITGEVTDGGNGLTVLTATGAGITETGGTLIVGSLEGSSVDSISLGSASTNTIARAGALFATSPTATVALTDTSGLMIFGPVSGPAGVYIQSAGATGIQINNPKSRVTAGAGANVSFQTDAFSVVNGGEVLGPQSQFELAPNTPNLGVTIGAAGAGLSLVSLANIQPLSVRIGEVTLPGGATSTTAGSIVIGGNFGTNSITLDLEARGQVTENASGTLSVGTLTGTAAGFTLTNPANALSVINNMTATGGDITVVNGQNLALSGTQSGNNLFYEVAAQGDNLSLGTFEASNVFPAILTAAAGGRISLVQDSVSQVQGSTVTATNGTVELAPFSAMNTSLAGSSGLVIGTSILGIIHTGATGTLVVGGFTDVPNGATVPLASAASVTIDGAVDLTGVASTLLLQSKGPITENAGPLTVGTLEATGTVITLNTPGNVNNAIMVLGDVTSTSFALNDTLALMLTGDVTATTSATITDTVSLTQTGNLTSPSITLAAGSGGIALDAPSVLGQTGATVDLSSTGGVNQAAGATLIAATLQSSNEVIGGAANFAGTANAVATLGNFVVNGNALSLSDTGPLNITGGVFGSAVTIGGAAGSTPTGITLTDVLRAPTITLSAGGGGIALNGASMLGQSGATVTLNSSGGVNEAPGATLTAGTLRSTGGVTGGAADFAGTANAIGTLGGFTVTGGALTLSDTGLLVVTGPVSASAVTIGGAAGSTPTGIALTGDLAAATITLTAGNTGIAMSGASVLGQSGALVDLTSTGGVDEIAGGTLIAGTLQSTGGVTGGAATFAGTANAIAGLGNFAVTGNALSLSDTGTLGITGPVTASAVTIGGAAGSTPTGITLTGDLTAPTITLSAGGSGIALNGAAVLGQSGALVDLTSTGGITEVASATLIAGTLQSTGGVSGGTANFAGTANTIPVVGNFTVSGNGNGFQLVDTGDLTVSGPLTAPGNITLSTGGAASATVSGNVGAGAGATLSITAGSGGIALNGNATAGTLDLVTTGPVSQSVGLTVGTLTGNAGSVVLNSNSNDVATLGSFATTSGGFDLNDTGNTGTLNVTGPVAAATIATINIGAAGLVNVTGSIGAGTLLAVIGGSGGITLNGNAKLTAPTIDLAASNGAIAMNGTSVVGQPGASVDLVTTGNITQAASSTLVAATLQTEGGAVVNLAGTANAVGALNGVIAGTSFTLNDNTNLTVNDEVLAPRIALLAPGQTVTLSAGATIITDGTPPPTPPGPLLPADEPSNGAPGAYIEAASFMQVGASTLTTEGNGKPTLQISITNSAQFDPPLGLQAPTGWLILNLGSGTATGNVVVNALNVTYDVPGSANLTGTIAGVAGAPAAASGFIQLAVNANYLFNGCEIGSAACLPVPPTNQTPELPPLYPYLPASLPPLPGLPPLQLLALPLATPACTSAAPATGEANAPEHTCALTDPDVVPPNVSYVDY